MHMMINALSVVSLWKMKEQDLIILMYANNECYTRLKTIAELNDKKFSVDLEKQEWSYQL